MADGMAVEVEAVASVMDPEDWGMQGPACPLPQRAREANVMETTGAFILKENKGKDCKVEG